jgi:hypothetical protein
MSKKISEKTKDNGKEFLLTDYEFEFLKELRILLQFNTGQQRVISNLLTLICINRLGYGKLKQGYDLQFEINLDKDKKLIVREVQGSTIGRPTAPPSPTE